MILFVQEQRDHYQEQIVVIKARSQKEEACTEAYQDGQ